MYLDPILAKQLNSKARLINSNAFNLQATQSRRALEKALAQFKHHPDGDTGSALLMAVGELKGVIAMHKRLRSHMSIPLNVDYFTGLCHEAMTTYHDRAFTEGYGDIDVKEVAINEAYINDNA